ncbi:MAG: PPOX class F420-dependent oxidoreductase [Dehalococcoidia bacterium]
MATIPGDVRAVIESGRLAHMVTVNRDGSPQVTCVWVGIEGDEIVAGHLVEQQKLRNLRRDARAVLSIETDVMNPIGLQEYLVVHGRVRIEDGGAPELLQRLAHRYLGPDVTFPPMENPPAGYVTHFVPQHYGGIGPWAGWRAE